MYKSTIYVVPKKYSILNFYEIKNKKLKKNFDNEILKFYNKNQNVKFKILYRISSVENALNIVENGFNSKYSKLRAFGKGINLTSTIDDLLYYVNMKKNNNNNFAIIVCKVVISKTHINDPANNNNKIFHNKYGYSKPTYMGIKKGFNAMHNSYKIIWVIPSGKRIYPKYIYFINKK